MTALPSNLALVGEDLARATLRDARRAAARRRTVAVSLALAVLVVTATAAVANGWLFGQTPTLRAVPSLGDASVPAAFGSSEAASASDAVANAETRHRAATPGAGSVLPLGSALQATARTLLTDLGPQRRVLSSVATTSGGVCFVLTGFAPQCTPTFASGQQVDWIVSPSGGGTTLIWGITRDEVTAIEAISAGGEATTAELANNGFYVEVGGGQPVRLVVHLDDGSSDLVPLFPCPLTAPNCTK
ncbi:MAG: hypothetical protein QOH00_3723 [Gaiellales bacterium]|jgi:hypothetical protein|nr:hypothetical protein [Gaiellales bacterium]